MNRRVVEIDQQFGQNIEEMTGHLEDIAGCMDVIVKTGRRKADALESIAWAGRQLVWASIAVLISMQAYFLGWYG